MCKECLWRTARLTVFSVKLAVEYILLYGTIIYKAPPTARGQWFSACDNRKDFVYEKECAEYLKEHGFTSVEVTKKSGDQGIDVIGWKDGKKYGFQCKYYSGTVPNKAVQEAHTGAVFYDCDVAVIMTTGRFSQSAVELARKIGVKLWTNQ